MILLLSSCEDYLTKDFKNGFVGENFMQNENQSIEAVTAIYDVMNWRGYYYWGAMCLGEGMSDNCENLWGDGGFGPDLVALHNYQWTGANQYFVYRWNNGYTGVSRANYVISKIDDVEVISEDMRQRLKGEALFLRAYFYYTMVGGYGDIPLVTEVITAEEANTVEKSPESEVWKQIIADLEEAATLLPASYSDNADLGRATSGAANAFLSRVYLWINDWQSAVDAANEVSGYSLVSADDFQHMFNDNLEFSSESIFECIHVNEMGMTWNAQRAENTILMHLAPFLTWGNYHHPRRIPEYDILDYFEDGDIRRKASILVPYVDSVKYNGDYDIFPETASGQYNWRPNIIADEVYQMRKFILEDATTFGYSNNYSVNHPILRFAEVLLNKAEGYVELNQLNEAATAIKVIRNRAGLDDMIDGSIPSLPSINGMVDIDDLNQNQMRELVRHERRIELMFENERWFDLKRWDALKTVLPAAGFNYDDSKHKYWPIPTAEVEINPNLAK